MASGSRVLGLNNNSIDRNLGGLASDNAPYSSRREKVRNIQTFSKRRRDVFKGFRVNTHAAWSGMQLA